MKYIDWTKFSSLIIKAQAHGAEIGPIKAYWDASMHCARPYLVQLASYPPADAISPVMTISDGHVRWLDIDTPCRKCEQCRENRRRLWFARAKKELQVAHRTWMATLTINPHHRFMFSLKSGSMDFMASHKLISKEITKYFKRLRKAGYKFRYVLVTEAHKDGYPHYHLLIHEGSAAIPKRALQAQWPYGFTNFKLVENSAKAAHYVSKYLGKDARTRIRASQKYGQSGRETLADLTDRLNDSFFKKNV